MAGIWMEGYSFGKSVDEDIGVPKHAMLNNTQS
jgi:hypothetical protein